MSLENKTEDFNKENSINAMKIDSLAFVESPEINKSIKTVELNKLPLDSESVVQKSKIDETLNDVCDVKYYENIKTEVLIEPHIIQTLLNLATESIFNELTQTVLKIVRTKFVSLKIFWILSLMFVLGFCSFLVVKSVSEYLSFEVTTKIRTVFETPTLFPKITICNKNAITTKYAYDEILNLKNVSNLSMNYTKISHYLNDILLLCKFNNRNCSTDDFITILDNDYGKCYVFNSGFNSKSHGITSKQSYIAGSKFGLKLVFYVNYYEKNFHYPPLIGMNIRIGNSSYMEFSDGFDVSSGFVTNLVIERKFQTMLPKPYAA